MQPPEPSENWLTALGTVFAGGIIAASMWLRRYLAGRAEGSTPDVHGKHVILEQAELANVSGLQSQLFLIGPKLDQIIAQDQARRTMIERIGGNLERAAADMERQMDEAMKILRRMDNELDVARRVREESLLRRRRADDGDDGR